ncbi:DivIVA domain-containing protein [Labedaea rhizosphaerae]|uniref:Cell wall synthesis protein Wag31 n=1 Tax=Labedaea rhizosphaerae TaxID=598644 RepID=A0A4R6SJN5_LABRH|nr:DivIVA domain-containing protein [Labedaea rhizosphaerae]TDQ04288.1 DivIVA domain-containing protein [Labedaea rhizosphaerae]
MPLTPDDVQDVRFDHAPLGKRGYNEDEVDDFLDQVELALRGQMKMTAQTVREVEFDQGGLVRRGYDEQQVDEFLEAVIVQLEGGEPNYVVRRANAHTRTSGRGGLINGNHNGADIIEALAAVDERRTADLTDTIEITPNGNSGRLVGTLHEAGTGHEARTGHEAGTEHVNGHSGSHRNGRSMAVSAAPVPAPRPQVAPPPAPEPDPNSVPLPPAGPGLHGYRQRDVQRMAECVRAAIRSPHGPTSEDIARMRLERVTDGEKGFDPFLVEALRDAWVAELRRQGR